MHSGDQPAGKVVINVSLVSRLVSAQFPQWAALPIKPVEVDGWDNRTFRLGEHRTVRLPSAAAYSAQVEKEHRWLPRLAPLLPLPIPVPLALGAPAAGYPWHWSIYRWLEGEIATSSASPIRANSRPRWLNSSWRCSRSTDRWPPTRAAQLLSRRAAGNL